MCATRTATFSESAAASTRTRSRARGCGSTPGTVGARGSPPTNRLVAVRTPASPIGQRTQCLSERRTGSGPAKRRQVCHPPAQVTAPVARPRRRKAGRRTLGRRSSNRGRFQPVQRGSRAASGLGKRTPEPGCSLTRERPSGYRTMTAWIRVARHEGSALGPPGPMPVRVASTWAWVGTSSSGHRRGQAWNEFRAGCCALRPGTASCWAATCAGRGSGDRPRARLCGDGRDGRNALSVRSDGSALRRTPEADLASIGRPMNRRNYHSGTAPQGQGRNSLLTLITRPRLLRSQPRFGLRPLVTSR